VDGIRRTKDEPDWFAGRYLNHGRLERKLLRGDLHFVDRLRRVRRRDRRHRGN